MRKILRNTIAVIAGIILTSCSGGDSAKSDADNEAVDIVLPSKTAEVHVIKLEPKIFNHEIVSNGKVSAHNFADLRFARTDAALVKVRASVSGANSLFDGMNVKVSVKRALDKQLVVPKSAVVLRTGKQVIFTYENGKAMWNYVHTGLENINEVVVDDVLKKAWR